MVNSLQDPSGVMKLEISVCHLMLRLRKEILLFTGIFLEAAMDTLDDAKYIVV